ncbi:unnamed protein product [Trichobilharzia szidati]|nr:unnamed protein product [Trichobilharzia szidati]
MSHPRTSQMLISNQSLTTMDTNTNVTNSPLASVNPTAVPCGQCIITTNAQNPLTGQQNLSSAIGGGGHKPQLGQNIVANLSKPPVQAVVHATGVSAVMETYVHGNRGLVTQYPIGSNTLHEIQTLPRVIEQQQQQQSSSSQTGINYRPVLIANTPGSINQLKSHPSNNHTVPGNQTYQMIAYPRQALNILQQTHGKPSHTISSGSTGNHVINNNSNSGSSNLMLAGVITPECLQVDSSNNAARIAQLLAPAGTHPTGITAGAQLGSNAQFLVYYPQHVNTGSVKLHSMSTSPHTLSSTTVAATASPLTTTITNTTPSTVNSGTGTPTIIGNHATLIPCKTTISTQSEETHSHSQQQQQQPQTVYYALATNDLIRQLKLNHQTIQIDSSASPRQQIIQTPSGLMFIQYPQQQQQAQQGHTSSSPSNIASQQQQQHVQSDNTLSRNQMTASSLAKHNAQLGVVNCGASAVGIITGSGIDSNTLPRHSTRVEHVQGSGLICTCPPEVHQAIFEQQKKRQQKSLEQNQPTAAVVLGCIPTLNKINTTNIGSSGTTTGTSGPSLETTEIGTGTGSIPRNSTNQVTGVPKENGLVGKIPHEDELTSQKKNLQSCHLTNCTLSGTTDTLKKSTPAASQNPAINANTTTTTTLKNSGVQPDSFKEAFERIGLPVNSTKLSMNSLDLSNKRQALLKTKLYQIEEMRKSVKSFHQLLNEFNRKFTCDMNNCNKIVMKLSNQQQNAKHKKCFDSRLEIIQNERRNLDRSLEEMHDISSELTEQLHDLECVIEQTGNDVLQHRCRITLPYVQTLENRLDSINSAVSVACGHYPEIQQVLNSREEAEKKAIEIQKRILDDQLYQLKDVNEKCKRIKGTIMTLKRLAIVNVQNRQRSNSPRRFTHLGGFVNRAAADRGSIERSRLYAAVQTIQPDSEKRLQAIKKQEMLAVQKRRVFSNENISTNRLLFTPLIDQKSLQTKENVVGESEKITIPVKENKIPTTNIPQTIPTEVREEKRAPLAHYSDDSLSSTTTTGTIDSMNHDYNRINHSGKGFNPESVTSMVDESSDSTLENIQPTVIPTSILKSSTSIGVQNSNSPKQRNRIGNRGTRGVMFNTTVTVDDGSEVVRLNCTLDDSELDKNKVPPTERSNSSPINNRLSGISDKFSRSKSPHERTSKTILPKSGLSAPQPPPTATTTTITAPLPTSVKATTTTNNSESKLPTNTQGKNNPVKSSNLLNSNNTGESKLETSMNNNNNINTEFSQTNELGYTAPTPPPRRSSQITPMSTDEDTTTKSTSSNIRQEGDKSEIVSPVSSKRLLPWPTSAEANESVTSPCE